MTQFLQRLWMFVLLVLVQVLVLNHMHIMGYATPALYIYYILKLNSETPRKSLLLQAFFIGLCIDIFSNTPGMNAGAATFMAFARRPLLRMQMSRDVSEDYEPGVRIMGFSPFLRYVLSEVFVFAFVLQVLNSFSFFHPVELFWKVVSDVLATIIFIMCAEVLRRNR